MLPRAIGVTKVPAVARDLAGLLSLLYHADGNVQIRDLLTAESGGPVSVEWHDPTDTVPAWALVIHAEYTIVLVSGCRSLNQAASTATGYFPNRLNVAPNERFSHRYFDSLGTAIFNDLRGRPGIQNQPLRLAGHSLGGCVLQTVGWLLHLAREITDNCQICTFGSPKWGWRWQLEQLASIPQARWMNSDDPVPLLVPTVSDFIPFLLHFTVPQALASSRFTQAAGGLVIDPRGNIDGADYPPMTSVQWQVALGSWLWGWEDGAAGNPHSLAQYYSRLGLWMERDLPPRMNPRPAEGIAPAEADTRRLVNRVQNSVVASVRAVEAAQRDVPIHVPRERLIRVEHRGGVHVLTWNGEAIAIVTRRRTATSLARNCNRFLEALLHAGLVQPNAIQTQLGQYLAAAGNTDSGIQPLIVSDLPVTP